MRTMQVTKFGRAAELRDTPRPEVKAGCVVIKVEYAGVNFVDLYWRAGFAGYRSKTVPFTLGMEGGGEVVEVGTDVNDFRCGDRVVGVMHLGAYADYWCVPSRKVSKVPMNIEMKSAVATALQGLTAHFLTHETYSVQPHSVVLVHAAAGGVGGQLAKLASRSGACVIGTCSTDAKAERAKSCGCTHVIRYDREDFVEEVQRLTDDIGVDVIYDSVGLSTFLKGFDCLKRRGLMCLFGQSSGAPEPLDPQVLRSKGSVFLTRPTLSDYMQPVESFRAMAQSVWENHDPADADIHSVQPLERLNELHGLLERRESKGKLLVRVR